MPKAKSLWQEIEKERKEAPIAPAPKKPVRKRAVVKETKKPTKRPVSQPVDQSIDQLTGKVVSRPVAFYLPEVINEKIDDAIEYIKKRHKVSVDRSALVSAILGNPDLWKPESLNELVDKAVSQLISRSTSRLKGK